MARPYKASTNQDFSTEWSKLMDKREALNAKIELLVRWSILREPCEASDSGKIVINCWCAECKEITNSISTKGVLPEWLR